MARSVLTEELRVLDDEASEAREEETEAVRQAAEAEAAEETERARREAEVMVESAEAHAATLVAEAQAKAERVRRALGAAGGGAASSVAALRMAPGTQTMPARVPKAEMRAFLDEQFRVAAAASRGGASGEQKQA